MNKAGLKISTGKFNCYFLLFLVICSIREFPQTIKPDSVNNLRHFKLNKLNLINFDELNMILCLKSNENIYSAFKFPFNRENQITAPVLHSISNSVLLSNNYLSSESERINNEFNSYLKFRKGIQLKTDLGEIGKILGNSKTIAAFVLLLVHLIKYRSTLY